MAEPPPVVVELVGWDGIDPLPDLPLFLATAVASFGGSLNIFDEAAVFWLEGWKSFVKYHRGDNDVPVQEAPVLGPFGSLLVRPYGENWEAMVLFECGEVSVFESKKSLLGISALQRSRGRSLFRPKTTGHKLFSRRG